MTPYKMQVSGKIRGVVLKTRFSYAEPGFFSVTHKNVGSAGSRKTANPLRTVAAATARI